MSLLVPVHFKGKHWMACMQYTIFEMVSFSQHPPSPTVIDRNPTGGGICSPSLPHTHFLEMLSLTFTFHSYICIKNPLTPFPLLPDFFTEISPTSYTQYLLFMNYAWLAILIMCQSSHCSCPVLKEVTDFRPWDSLDMPLPLSPGKYHILFHLCLKVYSGYTCYLNIHRAAVNIP